MAHVFAAGVKRVLLPGRLDVLHLPDLDGPFAFFFDRGCFHAVRQVAPDQYAPAVAGQLAAGGRGLILAGNAREPHDPGPPVVTEEQMRDELGVAFEILDLHEFRFDEAPGVPERFSGLVLPGREALAVWLREYFDPNRRGLLC